MNRNKRIGIVGLLLLVCLVMQLFAPAALAACKDKQGKKYKEHSYGKWKVVKEATCTKAGTKVKTCKHCGKKKSQEIPATGHDWGKWKVSVEATCLKAGKEVRTCKNCGKKKEREIEATGHDWGKWKVTVEATCKEAGTKVRVCKNCKKKQEKEIAALGHDWGEVEATVEATCKKAGKGTVTCLRCGKQKTQKLPALGHDWSEFEVTEPATCTAAGKEVSTCLNCGKEKTREIPATGHDWGKWQVTQEATCEAEGAESRKCTLCDAEETRVVPKTEHNWSKWQVTQEATCDAEGAESRKCTLCGAEETQNIPKTEHSWSEWSVTAEASCSQEGKQTRVCAICGAEETQAIPKTEHSWSEWSVTAEASCSQEGKQTRVCAICGAEETQNVPKTEHSWGEWTVTREATCTAAGEKTRTCGVCGEKQTEVGDPILPHTYVSQVTEPTCDAPGSVVYTCEVCGDTYTEEGEPALGHQWGEWTVTPATETAPEIRTRVCERCGLEEVVEVEAAATDEKTEAEETYTVTWLDGDEKTPLYTETCKVGDPVPESSAYKGSKEPTKVSEECTFAFTGWSAAETDQETGNVTYKPLFDKTVTISFAGWEGAAEKAPDPISAHPAEKLDLSAILPKTLTREGYTFIGYADGDGKAIADLTSFTVPEKHTTITAQWRANIKAIEIEAVESHLYKLSLEEAVKLLPAAGKATLADGTALDLKLTWDAAACVGKDGKKPKDLSVDGVYTFTAQFTDKAGKAIEHTLNEGVAAQCALTVSPIVSGDYEAHLDAKGNAVLTGWKKDEKEISEIKNPIPQKFDKHPLTAIGDKAFAGKKNLETLTLPAGGTIKSIGEKAFDGCEKLTTLVVSDGVLTIGKEAFANCKALTSLTLPDSLITIGEDVTLNDALTQMILSVSLETTLETGKKYHRAAQEGETPDPELNHMPAVTLPVKVTDLAVNTGAIFALGCDFQVGETNQIINSSGATMTVAEGLTLTNTGTLDNGGKLTFSGKSLVNAAAGTVNNTGTLEIKAGALTNEGTVDNSGTLTFEGTSLDNNASGTVKNTGALTLKTGSVTNKGALTVGKAGKVTLEAGCSMDNTGTVTNKGEVICSGSIVTCSGTWENNDAATKAKGAFHRKHQYTTKEIDGTLKNVCDYCGHTKAFTPFTLGVKYVGKTLTKPYDKTRNFQSSDGTWLLSEKLKTSSFSIEKKSGYTDVSILTLSLGKFSAADAGSYKLEARVYLTGEDAKYYDLKQDDKGRYYYSKTVKIPAKITKRKVTITPKATEQYPLTKAYGASDPAWIVPSASGLLNLTQEETDAGKKLYTGKLSRETGEDVGKYRITIGTLDFGNDNYKVVLEEAFFTIEKKEINASDISLVTIGNQRYTGKAIKPAVTLRYGARTLEEGKDFEVDYSDNVNAGTAKVKITGKGNYTGERTATFNILKITSDFGSGSSGSSSYSHSYSYTGFDSDDGEFEDVSDDPFDDDTDHFEDEEDAEEEDEGDDAEEESAEGTDLTGGEEDYGEGALVLEDVNYGTILFAAQGQPRSFVLFEADEEAASDQRTLTIIADPMTDETTGEGLYLEDGLREKYDALHLRLDTDTIRRLLADRYTEIVYEVEQADLHISLAALTDELALPGEALPEEAGEAVSTIPPSDPREGTWMDGMDLAPEEEEDAAGEEIGDLGNVTLNAGDDTLKVAVYDFCIEQVDDSTLTEREAQLMGTDQLLAPAYRVRVGIVPQGTAPQPTGAVDEAGEPITQALSQALPEGVVIQELALQVLPDENLAVAPTDVQSMFISAMNAPEDADVCEFSPAAFVDAEGTLMARIPVKADGLYALTAPEGWDITPYLAEEDQSFFDEGEDWDDEAAEEETGFDAFEEEDDGDTGFGEFEEAN